MGGGDLLNLLIERDVFEEDFARFYVAEVGTFFSHTCMLRFVSRWCWLSKLAINMVSFTVTLNLM